MRIIRCYRLGQDGGFRGWYDSQDADVKAKIEYVLELLPEVSDWTESPFYEDLRGKCEGLGEIKFAVGDDHYRLLGFDGPGRNDFTIVRWFLKKTNADYANECPQGLSRKEGVLKDASRAEEWPFDEDEEAGEEVS